MSLEHVQPLNEQEAIEELQGIQVRLMARIERIEDCESKRDECQDLYNLWEGIGKLLEQTFNKTY